MAEIIGGAAVGAVFGELLRLVIDTVEQTLAFNTQLTCLETTLKLIQPAVDEINRMSNRPVDDRTTITLGRLLVDGKKLVVKCSGVKKWNVIMRYIYAKRLINLVNKLLLLFNIEVPIATLTAINALPGGGRFLSCSVPGLEEFIIGLDKHLAELKRMLLKDDTRVLVISAPGGFGKTTLAKKLCHDNEIKGIFDDNILYVTVSLESSLKSIGQTISKHYNINNYEFRSEEDAKNQIESIITQKGSSKMLLVLDDVWSESLIRDLKFRIPGFKILVTSRVMFKKFTSTYDLGLLGAEDAKTLFCRTAFPSDGIPVNNLPIGLVNKMVKACKGIPLALTVVGASLCGEPEVVWRSTLKKWSEGQSILKSHGKLLHCLQTSIDALDEKHKDCFLDLGLFPEDDQIAGMALMDMWVELYNIDDEDASTRLRHLSSRNLISLVPIRKAAGEVEGHCSQYRVMQHDMLRELAIHLSRQKPKAKRRRLFMEICHNHFPKWWTQPVNAHILSISTDAEFSSTWNVDLNAPNVEVLILNIWSENYTLPGFIEKMRKLKVLIITGYGLYPTQLDNLQVLASLSNLSRIRFEHVSVSPSIQIIFTLNTLKKLTFVMCKIGDALSSDTAGSPYTLENLKYVEIDLCYDLKELPAGLCSSVQLQKLVITNCQELDSLPRELGSLSNLEILSLHCCTKLKELPESVGSLRKLGILDVSDCLHITSLPEQIGELSSLQKIQINGCDGLGALPKSLAELKQLETVICDEERSHLWKSIESDQHNVEIKPVEEDTSGIIKKIYH